MTPHLKCGKTYYCYATHFTLSVCNLVACMLGSLIHQWVGFSSIVASEWHCCVYIFSRFVSVSSSVGFHNSSNSSSSSGSGSSGKNSAFVLFQLRAKMRQVKISICGFGECVNVPWRLTPITRLENKSHFQIQQLRSISFCWICTVNEWKREKERARVGECNQSSNVQKDINNYSTRNSKFDSFGCIFWYFSFGPWYE